MEECGIKQGKLQLNQSTTEQESSWYQKIKLEVINMKTIQKVAVNVVVVTLLCALGGCAGMSTRDRNTAIGAGVGAVGGSILTGGSPVGTVGGAAVGGVIGNTIHK